MKKILSFLLFISLLAVPRAFSSALIPDLGEPGTKTGIGQGLTLTYSFNTHPALGMVVLKVKVTDKDGKPVEGLVIKGVSDMPEMHDSNSGKVVFLQNKKKDYLLPVNVTMPGLWQVTVTVEKGKKTFFTGVVNFHV
jgi:hypothetical protein